MTAQDVISMLDLKPLPGEGGFFRETFRSPHTVDASTMAPSLSGTRSVCAVAYYLITPTEYSSPHQLRQDEIWHFYAGDPADMINVRDDIDQVQSVRLGALAEGHVVEHTVPAGTWQSIRLQQGGSWALYGMTTSPGFEFEDCTVVSPNDLVEKFRPYTKTLKEFFKDVL